MQIDFKNIKSNIVGPNNGLNDNELNSYITGNQHIIRDIEIERENGKLNFLDLPKQDVSGIEKLARQYSGRFENFVVLGIGGSALGARALQTALCPPFYNLLSPKQRKNCPRLFILDNVDPDETNALLKLLDLKKTLFNVISKSGKTPETTAGFLLALDILKRAFGKKYREHLIITTDKEKGVLRKFANEENIVSFEVPQGVEGRYSVLSAVGLVPASFIGINISKLLKGARNMAETCRKSTPQGNKAYLIALVNWLMDTKKGKDMLIMMPYAYALKDIADWFRQLWAESLGKKFDLQGKEVFTGPTPINALGVTDQHSQIQLYNEGPNNKLVVFIEVEKFHSTVRIPRIFKDLPLRCASGTPDNRESQYGADMDFIQGKSFNELIGAEKNGTEISLTQNQRPNYTIKLPVTSEETIGGLIYFWELTTAYAGKLYNVNAFNQPGVEAGKIATRKILETK